MSMFDMFCLFKNFITAMTFVTDDEQRILLDAIQKAQSEGTSLLMPYCRQNKISQNIEVTAMEQMEIRMNETENKVCNNDNQLIDRSDIFGGSNIYNSTAITSDVNKFNKNDISRMIQNEIEKINLESGKDKSVSTDVSHELRNTIRAEFMTKDSNVRREYKLLSKTKYEHFMDFLRSELSIIDLLYVIDSTIKATVDFDVDVIERHKGKVRDIIINRIEQTRRS